MTAELIIYMVLLFSIALLPLFTLIFFIKKCPPNKIMVIMGKVGLDEKGQARSSVWFGLYMANNTKI